MRAWIMARSLEEQLSAHAQVRHEGMGVVVEREPQELATSTHGRERSTWQGTFQGAVGAADGSRMEHLHGGDGPPNDVVCESAANRFDLR